jgi:VanZ family protein
MKKFIPGIAWFFLVLILICLPGDDLPPTDDWMSAVYFDKWVHIGMFSVLSYLFMLPVAKSALPLRAKLQNIIKIAICVSLWGITTEFIQKFFIPGRSFDLCDWAADSFGAALAVFVIAKIYPKLRKSNAE